MHKLITEDPFLAFLQARDTAAAEEQAARDRLGMSRTRFGRFWAKRVLNRATDDYNFYLQGPVEQTHEVVVSPILFHGATIYQTSVQAVRRSQ